MANRGRPNKYEIDVKPRFNEITEWLKLGATDKEVAENLGIHKATFVEYKKKYTELNELIKKGRKSPVTQIKNAMLKRALGFQFEEKKVTTQKIVIDGVDGDKIPAKLIKTEITTKTALPSETAGLILLQHWAKDEGWTRDPQSLAIKKQELKLKEKQAEDNSW